MGVPERGVYRCHTSVEPSLHTLPSKADLTEAPQCTILTLQPHPDAWRQVLRDEIRLSGTQVHVTDLFNSLRGSAIRRRWLKVAPFSVGASEAGGEMCEI